MTDAAVTRLVRIVRAREDATKQAAREAERALRRLAQLDAERETAQAALYDAADRVVAAGVVGLAELAEALDCDAVVLTRPPATVPAVRARNGTR